MKAKILAAAIAAAFLVWNAHPATAQEHPTEHPGGGEHPTEHPSEHPSSKVRLSTETLAKAIEDFIAKDAALKGGWFTIWDAKAQKPLAFRLERVHKDRLASIGGGVYFACCDLKTPEGKTYDLDFFLEDTPEGLVVTEISIHKEEGQPRYGWKEENGIWVKQPVK
jgi:hypothetical protein